MCVCVEEDIEGKSARIVMSTHGETTITQR